MYVRTIIHDQYLLSNLVLLELLIASSVSLIWKCITDDAAVAVGIKLAILDRCYRKRHRVEFESLLPNMTSS